MRNDAAAAAGSRGSRIGISSGSTGGSSGRSPSSKFIRAISSYIRSVSSNAGNIAATVRTAGATIASVASQADDEKHREQVQWAGLDTLELSYSVHRHVLLLTYLNGYQVWDVEDSGNLREIVSKRDGRAAFLRLRPLPYGAAGDTPEAEPLLLVVTGDQPRGVSGQGAFNGAACNGAAAPRAAVHPHFVPTVVLFYSLRSHSYVHDLRFRTGICAVRCSRRVIAVALAAQIYCFDAASYQNIFSVLTYCTPNAGLGVTSVGYGALALGPRWMAYAANQPLVSSTGGRISPQNLTSPGISPSTSPAGGGALVAHYAKESSKQLAAGIMTLGEMGYKTMSKYCSEFLPDGVSPTGTNGTTVESENAGNVIVRDYVSKKVVAQFRAHSSPISALCFDPSGTLLVTASVYGHNLNVFRLTPPTDSSAAGVHGKTTHVHLYKLCRGLTNAIIQDISFSHDSNWIAVSTSRGTSHLFAISPFGGVVGPQTHGACSADPFNGPAIVPTPAYPWWTSTGPLRASQQALPPPPPAITLSVVSRIKNGLGVWRGAARTNGSAATSGAVAAGFHNDCRSAESDSAATGASGLQDKLWVLSPSGFLMRYLLKPSTGTPSDGNGNGGNHGNGGYNTEGSSSPGPGQSQDLRLVVEPLEKWDVCRRVNWVEREASSENGNHCSGSDREECLSDESSLKSGKDCMTAEELQRWYMSNAEVQISQARPLPVWAKPNITFHAMMVNGATTELEVEKIPSQIVEVRRKDLKPLVERLQRLDNMHHGNLSSDCLVTTPNHRMQSDFIGGEGMIQRSSSGSSYGSEGPLADSSCGSNGFQHNYQDFSDVYISATSPRYHGAVTTGRTLHNVLTNPNNHTPLNGLHPQHVADVVLTDPDPSSPLSIPRVVDKGPAAASSELNVQTQARVKTAVFCDHRAEAVAVEAVEGQAAVAAAVDASAALETASDQDQGGSHASDQAEQPDKAEEDEQNPDAWEGGMFPFCEDD